jgi:tetratricopeptide (TPR) repeat protein
MMKTTNLPLCLAFGLLLSPASGQAQPSFAKTMQFWKDPEFVNKFMASYGVKSDVEPKINADEKELFDELIPQIKDDPKHAIVMLAEAITSETSAALEFTLANLYVQASDYPKAVAQYRAAIKKFPDFQRAHMNLGVVLIQLDQHAEAQKELVRTLELGGEDGNIYGLIGYCHLVGERYLSAEAAYRKASLFSPDKLDWKLGIAQCQLQQQKYGECLTLFGELIQRDPDNADYWLHQANAYLGLAESNKAATNYEVVRRMGKADATVLNQLGDIYMNSGTYDLAFTAYTDAAAVDKLKEIAPPIRAADILISVGEFDRGNSLITQIRAIHKNKFKEGDRLKILQLEARVQLAKGEEAKAIKTLQQIVDKDPLDGESLLLLADYHGRNDEAEKAELFFQRAEQLNDFEVRAKITHAQFLVHRGQYAKAVPLLKSAQAKRPRDSVQRYLEQVVKLSRLAKG